MKINVLYRSIIIFAIFLCILSCKEHQSIYGFDTKNCRVKMDVNGNTHFIQLSCAKWDDVQIDYGFGVYSYSKSYSPEDYLKYEKWKLFAIPFLNRKAEEKVNLNELLDSIKVLSIDDSLNAKLSYLGHSYEHKIIIPEELADLAEIEETKGAISKRLIYSKTTMKTFQYYLVNNANVQHGFPETISVYLRAKEPVSLEEITQFLKNIKLPYP